MSQRAFEMKANARRVAERLRLREAERSRPAINFADPDARESVTSSARAFWPPDVVRAFHRAHVIRNPPVRLYDDLPPEASPARPRDKKGTA